MLNRSKPNLHSFLTAGLCLGLICAGPVLSAQVIAGGSKTAAPLLTGKTIDAGALVPLAGHVRSGLLGSNNAGPVADSMPSS